MLSMLVKTCRVCGKSSKSDRHVNIFESKNKRLIQYIQLVTGLRLRDLKDAPVFMCYCCQSDLKLVMSFRRLCMKTQKKWQPNLEVSDDFSLSDQESPIPSPKQSICRSYTNTDVSTNRESDSDDEPQETLQVMLNESKTIVNISSTNVPEEHDHLDLDYVMNANTDIDTDERSDLNETDNKNNSEVPNSIIAPTQDFKKLRKVNKEEAIYICELCGKYVNKKSTFERHMRTHRGERPFACENCTARFLSAAELRAHGLTHSGERPFPCRYCDRKYVSYTGRQKHERMHRNDRPFVCEECGKAFTNTYILKNHMLVHTGERLFRCDICQRSFQRKTHLTTHYRSNTHMLNVEKHQGTQVEFCGSNPMTDSD